MEQLTNWESREKGENELEKCSISKITLGRCASCARQRNKCYL